MNHAILIAVVSMTASVSATPAAEASTFSEIFDHYEAIRQVLIEDSTEGVAHHATAMADAASALAGDFDPAAAPADARVARSTP